jgi:hypothetical protein
VIDRVRLALSELLVLTTEAEMAEAAMSEKRWFMWADLDFGGLTLARRALGTPIQPLAHCGSSEYHGNR